jgi:hypothetical protein
MAVEERRRESSFQSWSPRTNSDSNAVFSCTSEYGTMSGPRRPTPFPDAKSTGWARKM